MNRGRSGTRTWIGNPISLALASAALSFVAAGCGGDDDTGTNTTSTATCGTPEAPELLTLADVAPAAGSSVLNTAIVHAFTVKDAPGQFPAFSLLMPGGKHTAGSASVSPWKFAVTMQGADVHYAAEPLVWQTAPGEVYVQIPERFQSQDGCVYAFPDPVFQYSITEGGGGAGGSGTGGSGGSGTGGEATGGAGGAGGG